MKCLCWLPCDCFKICCLRNLLKPFMASGTFLKTPFLIGTNLLYISCVRAARAESTLLPSLTLPSWCCHFHFSVNDSPPPPKWRPLVRQQEQLVDHPAALLWKNKRFLIMQTSIPKDRLFKCQNPIYSLGPGLDFRLSLTVVTIAELTRYFPFSYYFFHMVHNVPSYWNYGKSCSVILLNPMSIN